MRDSLNVLPRKGQVWKGSVMICAGIIGNIKTDLVFVEGNLNAEAYVNILHIVIVM